MRLLQIDAFTSEAFRGNPAAVCLLGEERDAAWMQDVAMEMNLSETAFLLPRDDGFSLRWFTPAAEVALCGHATLASAHALWEENVLGASDVARFHTKSGLLTAERKGEWIELDFPATPDERTDPRRGCSNRSASPALSTSDATSSTTSSKSPRRTKSAASRPTTHGCARSPSAV